MPRTKKPAGTAVDPRNGRRTELQTGQPAQEPAINRDAFLPTVIAAWDAYWSDPAATTQTPADRMWAMIWVERLDDHYRKQAMADQQPLVKGSMGQLVANPLYAVAQASLAAAERAARQMGIGAKNRADLGVTLLAERAAVEDINVRYLTMGTGDDGADDDPR